tara:strand:+ start:12728 stop:13405 length:678 start_codon:yes stop_codon:yes gene_type:complete
MSFSVANLSAHFAVTAPVGSKQTTKPRTARTAVVTASKLDTDRVALDTQTSRRAAVLSIASAVAFLGTPTFALAVRGQQVCDPTEDGAECRQRLLVGDEADLGGYEQKSQKQFKAAAASTNPDLTNYQKDTLNLVEEMEVVLALDIYDMTREKQITALKKDGNTWSSKYAPGGSTKTASGRAFYNAINQVSGHFNANGIAPLPASRQEVVNENLAKTRELIAAGR